MVAVYELTNPYESDARSSLLSSGLEDQIRVLNGVSRSDQPDCVGDTLLKLNMWFEDQRDSGKRLLEFQPDIVAIRGKEFLGHEGPAGNEVGADRPNYIEHSGDIVDQGDVNGFYPRPEGKTAIGDHQRISMANAAEE